MADNVTVADAIKQLRAQLEDAQKDSDGKNLRFWAKTVEVEMSVVFKSETEAGAGIKAWFVDLSAKGKAGQESGHKVKLILEPVGPDGKVLVAAPAQDSDTSTRR